MDHARGTIKKSREGIGLMVSTVAKSCYNTPVTRGYCTEDQRLHRMGTEATFSRREIRKNKRKRITAQLTAPAIANA
ncbi:hypothetical protein Tco_0720269 [Tanacetum coccineum]